MFCVHEQAHSEVPPLASGARAVRFCGPWRVWPGHRTPQQLNNGGFGPRTQVPAHTVRSLELGTAYEFRVGVTR